MFVTRLISGIVLVAVALLTICSGGWILYGTLTIVSLIGMFELYRAVKVQKQGEKEQKSCCKSDERDKCGSKKYA